MADLNKSIEETRALFYKFEENYTLAINDYTQAIELEKIKLSFALHYYSRGECYQELKIYDKAIEDYKRAIELGENEESMKDLLTFIHSYLKACYNALGK